MSTWFIDREETYWRLSKYSGGLQAELPDGEGFGEVTPIQHAVDQFGIEQLPKEICMILDQFDKVKITDSRQRRDFEYLRKGVIEIVKFTLTHKNGNKGAIEGNVGKEDLNDVKGE
jgi:hypothetical protein